MNDKVKEARAARRAAEDARAAAALKASEARSAQAGHEPPVPTADDDTRADWRRRNNGLRAAVTAAESEFRAALAVEQKAAAELRAAEDAAEEARAAEEKRAAEAREKAERDALSSGVHRGESGWSSELVELRAIEDRSSISEVFDSVMRGRPAAGVEAELRAALNGAADHPDLVLREDEIPLLMLAPRPEDRDDVWKRESEAFVERQRWLGSDAIEEHRADVTVATPGDIQAYQGRIVARVFAASVLGFIGVRPEMVMLGDHLIPVVRRTGAASGGWVAKGAKKDTQDFILDITRSEVKRITAGYRLSTRDTLRVRGLESALRMDLGQAMRDSVEREIMRGSGAANNVRGFFNQPTSKIVNQGSGGPPETFDTAVARMAKGLDGYHARGMRDVKVVVNAEAGRRLATQFRGDTSLSVLAYAAQFMGGAYITEHCASSVDRAAGVGQMAATEAIGATQITVDMFTAGEIEVNDEIRIAGDGTIYTVTSINQAATTEIGITPGLVAQAADNAAVTRAPTRASDALLVRTGPGRESNAKFCVWRGLRLEEDRKTRLAEGEKRIIAEMYCDFQVPRGAGFEIITIVTPEN